MKYSSTANRKLSKCIVISILIKSIGWLCSTRQSLPNLINMAVQLYTICRPTVSARGRDWQDFSFPLSFPHSHGREAGKAIGRQGLESGVRVRSGLLDGQDLRQLLEHESRAGLKNLLDKTSNNLAKSSM